MFNLMKMKRSSEGFRFTHGFVGVPFGRILISEVFTASEQKLARINKTITIL